MKATTDEVKLGQPYPQLTVVKLTNINEIEKL